MFNRRQAQCNRACSYKQIGEAVKIVIQRSEAIEGTTEYQLSIINSVKIWAITEDEGLYYFSLRQRLGLLAITKIALQGQHKSYILPFPHTIIHYQLSIPRERASSGEITTLFFAVCSIINYQLSIINSARESYKGCTQRTLELASLMVLLNWLRKRIHAELASRWVDDQYLLEKPSVNSLTFPESIKF